MLREIDFFFKGLSEKDIDRKLNKHDFIIFKNKF